MVTFLAVGSLALRNLPYEIIWTQQHSSTLLDFEVRNWDRRLGNIPGLLLVSFVAFEVVVLAAFHNLRFWRAQII
jgi:hypothetical protein